MITMVICTIQVVAIHFVSHADVKGKVLAENDTKYVVDFSIEAKKNGYEGDYSNRLVNKLDCVILPENKGE